MGGPVNLLSSSSALFVSFTRSVRPYCKENDQESVYPIPQVMVLTLLNVLVGSGGVSQLSHYSQGKSETISMLPAVVSSIVDTLDSPRLATIRPQGP